MYDIGDSEIRLIAQTILGEAAREPTQGKAGVGHVIMNRLRSGNYGKTIQDVLFAPRQFEPWNTRRSELLSYGPQTPGWEEAENIAKTVARGLAPDPTGGALNFLNRGYSAKRGDSAMRSGGWGNNMANPIQIGAHTFGTAAGAGTGREGRIRVASADPNFVPGGAPATAAPAAAASPTMPMGGLGGLGGYQPPTGMQTFGDILSALGMSLLSSPSNNMFQALPQTYTAIQGRRGKEAERAQESERWATEFGFKKQALEAQRAEQAIDNARQERALAIQQQNAERSGHSAAYNTTRAMYKDLVPGTPEFLEKLKEVANAGDSAESFGTTPQTYYDKEGNPSQYIIGNRGTVRPVTPGEGLSPNPKGKQVKTATEILTYDGAGNIIAREPLNREQGAAAQARGTEVGKAEGIAQIDAPKRLDNIGKALKELKEIKDHPAREATTGWQANLGLDKWAGTPQNAFAGRVNQATAGAFLEGAQSLKGLGQMTEIEGAKATQAINRMQIAQGDAEFLAAVKDYEDALVSAQKKIEAAQRGGQKAPPPGYRNPVPGAGRAAPTREEALEELRRRGRL